MTVQFIISGELIEEIPVSFAGCRCYEEKWGKILDVANWLKYRYRSSINLKDDWEIVAVNQSTLNNCSKFNPISTCTQFKEIASITCTSTL